MDRRRKYTDKEIEKWAKEYKRLHSFKEVADIFGVSSRVIQKILERDREKFGIETRKSLSEKKLKLCYGNDGCGKIKRFDEFGFRSGKRSHILHNLCIECRSRYHSKYRKDNREVIAKNKHLHYIKNKDKFAVYSREYYLNNRERLIKYSTEYSIKKYAEDINYKLASGLRTRLRIAINSNQKSGSAVKDLGCSIPELKQHLEDQFYPHPETGEQMTWDNWSQNGWNIDHIKALALFDLTDREQFLEACHYTNLQPLWVKDHITKTAKDIVKIRDIK